MHARYYDPVIGRFLSNDPVGFGPGRPQMFNRYSYTLNDPVNAIDPDGLNPCAVGALVGASGGPVGAGAGCAVWTAGAVVVFVALTLSSSSDNTVHNSSRNEGDGSPEAGDQWGGATLTDDDIADDIFDWDALDDQKPRNENEADAIRDAVRGNLGEPEMEPDAINDPAHEGETKMRHETDGGAIHYWEGESGNTYGGKIKERNPDLEEEG